MRNESELRNELAGVREAEMTEARRQNAGMTEGSMDNTGMAEARIVESEIEDRQDKNCSRGNQLQAASLSVGYGKKLVAGNISFSVKVGEILVLIGPNGAGKSTILKTLTGQLKAMAGAVYLGEKELGKISEREVAKLMAIAMTGRPGAELMTVWDMVATGRYPYTGRLGLLSDKDKKVVDEVLDMVGLTEIQDADFSRISDGQKQRTMLARAIAQEPEILIMDEPTSYLDVCHKLELLSILKELVRKKQIAVILSLHELDLAQKAADYLLCIADGKVDRFGTCEEIFQGDYISRLYGIRKGSYLTEYGCVELEKAKGKPEVFVIGGGGYGIPIYRMLQRKGISFAAGVLQKNDLDYPVASALSDLVVSAPAFEEIEVRQVETAKELLLQCPYVIQAVPFFGNVNRRNEDLVLFARARGISVLDAKEKDWHKIWQK